MKRVSYAWSAIVGLLTLAVALLLLVKFSSPFERVVIDVLVLIYVSVDAAFIVSGMVTVEQSKLHQTRFLTVMKGSGSAEFETGEMREYLREEQERIDRQVVKGYIRSVCVFLIYLAALWSLFGDLTS